MSLEQTFRNPAVPNPLPSGMNQAKRPSPTSISLFGMLQRPDGLSFLVALGWILPWAMNSEMASVAAGFFGTLLGVGWFWNLLKSPGRLVHLLEVGAMALVVLLNSSFVLAWFTTTVSLNQDFSDTFDGIYLSFGNYALALIYAMFFAMMMAYTAKLPGMRRIEDQLLRTLLAIRSSKISTISSLLGICLIINFASVGYGVIAFRSVQTEGSEVGQVAWFLPFLFAVFSVQIVLNSLLVWKATSTKKNHLLPLLLAFLSTVCITFIYFTQGRGAFVMGLSLHFIYFCLFKGSLPRAKTMILIALLAAFIIPSGSNLFQLMRGGSAITQTNFDRGTNALDSVQRGLGAMGDQRNVELSRARTLENLSTRPLIANPLARCIAIDGRIKNFLWGQCIVSSFVWTLPRVIAPWKAKYPPAEALFYYNFPDRAFLRDSADSLYLYGYADFGIFGILIYPILIAALWASAVIMMHFVQRPLLVWILFCSWPPQFLLTIGEGSLISWFVLLRNTLMFTAIFIAIEAIAPYRRPGLERKIEGRR